MDGTESNGSLGPEVSEKARGRRFKAAYKLRILAEAERCIAAGQLGELLRLRSRFRLRRTLLLRSSSAAELPNPEVDPIGWAPDRVE